MARVGWRRNLRDRRLLDVRVKTVGRACGGRELDEDAGVIYRGLKVKRILENRCRDAGIHIRFNSGQTYMVARCVYKYILNAGAHCNVSNLKICDIGCFTGALGTRLGKFIFALFKK